MVKVNLTWDIVEQSKELIEIKNGQDDYDKFVLTKLVRTESESSSLFNGLEWYRSVVWDKEKHLPIAISPRKSEVNQNFVVDSTKDYFLEDFVEGTMLNLWALPGDDKTYVATRSSLGATGTFFSMKSFKCLLDEAMNLDGVGECIRDFLHKAMNNGVISRFMSVVLRHPENRFVEFIEKPEVVLIYCGESVMNDNGSATIHIFEHFPFDEANNRIHYVKDYPLPENTLSVQNLQEILQNMAKERSPTWQGLMLSDSDGRRWKFVNPEYSRLRNLRSENRQDVRMIQLSREDISVVGEYLKYFPEEINGFLKINSELKNVIWKLYIQYVDLHIKKTITVDGLRDYFRPHVYALHGLFLNVLKARGHFIRLKEVRDYLNKQPWQRVLFLISRMNARTGEPRID